MKRFCAFIPSLQRHGCISQYIYEKAQSSMQSPPLWAWTLGCNGVIVEQARIDNMMPVYESAGARASQPRRRFLLPRYDKVATGIAASDLEEAVTALEPSRLAPHCPLSVISDELVNNFWKFWQRRRPCVHGWCI